MGVTFGEGTSLHGEEGTQLAARSLHTDILVSPCACVWRPPTQVGVSVCAAVRTPSSTTTTQPDALLHHQAFTGYAVRRVATGRRHGTGGQRATRVKPLSSSSNTCSLQPHSLHTRCG